VSRIVQALLDAGDSVLYKQCEGSFGSIDEIIRHLDWAERVWLSRIKTSYSFPSKDSQTPTHIVLKRWTAVRAMWLQEIQRRDASERISFHDTKGHPYQNTFEEIALHVIDHCSYHIGQIANHLRSFGLAPPQTNYIHYLRDNPEARS